ncbi:MAG: hypothetical protein GF334_03215 [Candidatus Altiarchaeales archaeon]|nr:hypothetical protein [Candidatus Altiarchaeales archaeon]
MRSEARKIVVNDLMQRNYVYHLTEPAGRNFHPDFQPQLTPKRMLELGVFGGKYMTDCGDEYPESWFKSAKLSPRKKTPQINFFKVDASLPLSEWRRRGWIYWEDPRGWFQWYCRYYRGRRCEDDLRQIKRWVAMKRHLTQVQRNCAAKDLDCRRKQRQALLHWAYDSRQI